jgi:hypothetical protein
MENETGTDVAGIYDEVGPVAGRFLIYPVGSKPDGGRQKMSIAKSGVRVDVQKTRGHALQDIAIRLLQQSGMCREELLAGLDRRLAIAATHLAVTALGDRPPANFWNHCSALDAVFAVEIFMELVLLGERTHLGFGIGKQALGNRGSTIVFVGRGFGFGDVKHR